MIVSAGYNIAGPEVEAALLSHPAVLECAVIGAPDEARGQIVEAHVVLAAGHDRRRADGQADPAGPCEKVIAPYKYPRSIIFTAALPKTQTGKIQRFRLAARDDHALHVAGAFIDPQRPDLAVKLSTGWPWRTPSPPCSCTAMSITSCAASVA
jgi:acyl-coenzyme A synthetase/AMP-(fatty) acid ligase